MASGRGGAGGKGTGSAVARQCCLYGHELNQVGWFQSKARLYLMSVFHCVRGNRTLLLLHAICMLCCDGVAAASSLAQLPGVAQGGPPKHAKQRAGRPPPRQPLRHKLQATPITSQHDITNIKPKSGSIKMPLTLFFLIFFSTFFYW
jgi:hypothetical protein